MEKRSVEAIVRALQDGGVRYLIVGGLAVVAHGYLRLTADVDIVLDPAPDNIQRALTAFDRLGYRPRAPVPLQQFADASQRQRWAREKHMVVFSLSSPHHPATEVDLFLQPPLDFGPAFESATRLELAPGAMAIFVGLEDLVRLKRKAGRPQDLDDIATLQQIAKDRDDARRSDG